MKRLSLQIKKWRHVATIREAENMADKLMKYEESNGLYSKIVSLITSRKTAVSQALNAAVISLNWEIGETICLDV